jgi:hypothetical protein
MEITRSNGAITGTSDGFISKSAGPAVVKQKLKPKKFKT